MRLKDFFTLSYDDKELKVLQIKKNRKVCFGRSSLRPGIIFNGKILRKEMFAENLKVLLGHARPLKINTSFVVSAIPESKVFIKILELPKIPLDKIEQAIIWQAESLLPVAPENVYLDWQKIAETKEGKLKILLTACPKEIIDSLTESLCLAGLVPVSIKPKSNALAGLFSRTPHKPILIVNIEKDETSLIVAKNNIARVSTSLATSADKKPLTDKIKETVDFYQIRKAERAVEEVVILGEGVDAEYVKHLEAQIKMPVRCGRYSDKTGMVPPKDESNFLVNLGLVSNPSLGVNLLPANLQEEFFIKESNLELTITKRIFTLAIFAVIFAMGIAWLLLLFDGQRIRLVLNSASLARISPNIKEIENQITDLNKRLARIDQLENQRSQYALVLEKLKNISQEGITILSFSREVGASQFKLTGVASAREQLLAYKVNLQQSGAFRNIIIPLKSLEHSDNVNFEIYFEMTK